jgi:glucokinase
MQGIGPCCLVGEKMELYAGFDLGGTNLKYGLIDTQGRVLRDETVNTPESMEELFVLLEDIWVDIQKNHHSNIKGVGFGFPGIFNSKEQIIIQSPNCPQIDGHALVPSLKKFVKVPFSLDNEANYAAYGEYKIGAGKGAKSLVLLTIGTGIGTGIILNDQLWQGVCGFAGELGHVTVNPEGEKCLCGNMGCLETEVSAQKIVICYNQFSKSKEILAIEEIAYRAVNGDEVARQSFERAGYYLGIGLAVVINLLNPEKILLGGGVMESGEFLLPAALEEAKRRSFRASYNCCCIEQTQLGNKAGFIGAALWARDHFTIPQSEIIV